MTADHEGNIVAREIPDGGRHSFAPSDPECRVSPQASLVRREMSEAALIRRGVEIELFSEAEEDPFEQYRDKSGGHA